MANDILVKIGADISDFSKKMAESSRSLEQFGEANQQTFDSFKQVGAVVTGAGVAVASGLGFAVKKAADFESGMSKVSAVSGATGKDFDALSERARELGGSTSFSATEAANGLEYLALAGWDTTQMINGLEPVLHLAEAGALDLGRSADLVTDSMAGLGLGVDELDGYLDKVAQTSRKSNTDIDALMEAFVIAGGTFERLNVPLEESTAMLGVLANRGFKGSEAGTAMNAIMTRLTSTTGPAAKALKEMGISAYDSEGNFRGMETVMKEVEAALSDMTDAERARYTEQLAGLDHGKTFSAMLSGLGNEYDELKDSIINSDGALKEMRDTMKDNLQGALENLSSAFEEIAISIGTALLPIVKAMAGFVQTLADKFNSLSDTTKTTIAVILAIVSALALIAGPLLLLIGFIPQIIAGFTVFMTVVKAVGAALAFLASPIALVVAAVIAAAAIIYVYWEPISEFFINLWETIKEAGLSIWESLKEIWQSTVDFLVELFTPMIEFFTNLWNSVMEVATEIWSILTETLSTVWENIKTAASAAWELIKNVILGPILLLINLVTGDMEEFSSNLSAIWINIKEAGKTIFESIKTIITTITDAIKSVIDTIWKAIEKLWMETLKNIAKMVGVDFESIRKNIENIMNAVKSVIDAIWNFIRNTFKNVLSFLKALVSGDFKGMWNAIKSQMDNIRNTVSTIWDAVKTIFSNLIEAIKTVVKQKFTDMVNSVKEKMDDVKRRIEDGWNNAVKFLKNIDLRQIGKDIIQGLINGIRSMIGAVSNAIKDVTSVITGKVKSILQIKSPSRVMMAIGEDTGEGLAIGIADTRKDVERAAQGLADAAIVNPKMTAGSAFRSQLSSTIANEVDVSSRDTMLAHAIESLEGKLANLTVQMDGQEVARITNDYHDRYNATKTSINGLSRGVTF